VELVCFCAILYTMGIHKKDKLNSLQRSLPEGLVADAAWLEKHGYSGALRQKYVARGWLNRVAHGVYRRPAAQLPSGASQTLNWQTVVISLQAVLRARFVVGGRTALELQGFTHFLSAAPQREVHLYGTDKRPGWVAKLNLETQFVFHNAQRLFPNDVVLDPNREVKDALLRSSYTRESWGKWDWPLVTSTPERAILELLDEVPERETFDQANMFFEGLHNLSPRKMQPLLQACRSVKVKRLFMWFAERHQLPWFKTLDRRGVDLGKGKRMLVKGGKLDPKFNITVPGSLDGDR
jgi:hypothetical protein